MKNIQGTFKNLKLFDENGKKVYEFFTNSNGYSYECTFNPNGKVLIYSNSDGYSYQYTLDASGNELTYENSNGVKRGFAIPMQLHSQRLL